jgi:hypothetical protein
VDTSYTEAGGAGVSPDILSCVNFSKQRMAWQAVPHMPLCFLEIPTHHSLSGVEGITYTEAGGAGVSPDILSCVNFSKQRMAWQAVQHMPLCFIEF